MPENAVVRHREAATRRRMDVVTTDATAIDPKDHLSGAGGDGPNLSGSAGLHALAKRRGILDLDIERKQDPRRHDIVTGNQAKLDQLLR